MPKSLCVLIMAANLLFLGLGLAVMLGTPLREWLWELWGAAAGAYGATGRNAVKWTLAAFSAARGIVE